MLLSSLPLLGELTEPPKLPRMSPRKPAGGVAAQGAAQVTGQEATQVVAPTGEGAEEPG